MREPRPQRVQLNARLHRTAVRGLSPRQTHSIVDCSLAFLVRLFHPLLHAGLSLLWRYFTKHSTHFWPSAILVTLSGNFLSHIDNPPREGDNATRQRNGGRRTAKSSSPPVKVHGPLFD